MTTTRSMKTTLTEIITKVKARRESQHEDYTWYYLREAFPAMAEQGLNSLALHVLRHASN